MQFIGIIPARYQSSRFPGKPLAMLGNKAMIQRTYEKASEELKNVYVATDDIRIYDKVNSFGGKVIMTSKEHQSGTDRVFEAANKIVSEIKFDVVINIQGDEPFLSTTQIKLLKECFNDEKTEIATLIKKIKDHEDLFNPNTPKVITNTNNDAIYFSRETLPHQRNTDKKNWLENFDYFKHIGIYAYKYDILKKLVKLPLSELELAECLEQNRWLENGYKIKTALTNEETIAVDAPEDISKLKNKGLI